MKKLDVSELRQERELLTRINEMLRLIEEEGETIEITDKGKVVAHLVPTIVPEKATEQSDAAAWEELKRLAVELDPYWPEDADAVEIVRNIRRDL